MDVLDIHTHILPGVDDGPSTDKEALSMLKKARTQEITEVIATPHYSGKFPNDCPERIREMCREIQEKAQRAGIHIRIWPGQEIFYGEGTAEKLERGELLTLADSRYVLVEFHPEAPYSLIFRALRELMTAGYYPVLAHVERYRSLRKENRIDEITGQGAYLQMNFRSVGGSWYNERTRWCRKTLREGKIHFLGTDMHNMTERSPETREALRWMERHLDRTCLFNIVRGNAEKILADKKI